MIGFMYAGEDRRFNLAFLDSSGAPFSVAGYGVEVTINLGTFGTVIKTVGSGVTLNTQSGLTLGTAYVVISDADTVAVDEIVDARFSVRLDSPGGDTTYPIDDTLIVRAAP